MRRVARPCALEPEPHRTQWPKQQQPKLKQSTSACAPSLSRARTGGTRPPLDASPGGIRALLLIHGIVCVCGQCRQRQRAPLQTDIHIYIYKTVRCLCEISTRSSWWGGGGWAVHVSVCLMALKTSCDNHHYYHPLCGGTGDGGWMVAVRSRAPSRTRRSPVGSVCQPRTLDGNMLEVLVRRRVRLSRCLCV